MKIPFIFSLFVLFIIIYNLKLRKVDKEFNNEKNLFFEKERKAMFVRKKSLDNLNYVNISLDELPLLKEENVNNYTYNEKKAYQYQQNAFIYSNKPMLDLSGINNTDLKLEYGPTNLNTLIEYEQNYHCFLKSLLYWGEFLYKANRLKEAMEVLEKGIHIESDLSRNYILLANIYKQTNLEEKLLNLKKLTSKKAKNNIMFKKALNHIKSLLKEE